MDPKRSSSDNNAIDLNEDLISSTTSTAGVIAALASHGCVDLTSAIDLIACGNLPLAGGGFCDVYHGALHSGTKIAIKVLRAYNEPGADGGRNVIKRAARELYHWSKLRHRNVLPLMGLAVFRGHISMISPWMENDSLISYIQRSPDVDRLKLCMDVCAGLCYIHTNDTVHGDLKAANIMVSSDGTALIADFGNAQLKDLTLKFSGRAEGGLSVRWAAPELLLGDSGPHVSKEADVYAFGMTVLETYTGEIPYSGVNDKRVIVLVAYEKKLPPRPNFDMPDKLWSILTSCWTREPSERPGITDVSGRLRALFPGSSKRGLSDPGIKKSGQLQVRSVPQTAVDSVGEQENTRQETTNEAIYADHNFARDLEHFRDVPLGRLEGGVDAEGRTEGEDIMPDEWTGTLRLRPEDLEDGTHAPPATKLERAQSDPTGAHVSALARRLASKSAASYNINVRPIHSPRTVQNKMVDRELSESLRSSLMRDHTSTGLAMGVGAQGSGIRPLSGTQPGTQATDGRGGNSRRRSNARTFTLHTKHWANDYNQTGW